MYVDELKKCLTEQTFAENKIIALYLFAFCVKSVQYNQPPI